MRDGQLLEKQEIDKMYVLSFLGACRADETRCYSRHIPTIVVQGRYDCVCPVCARAALQVPSYLSSSELL